MHPELPFPSHLLGRLQALPLKTRLVFLSSVGTSVNSSLSRLKQELRKQASNTAPHTAK